MPTIADITKAVLIETGNDGVGSGDMVLLDQIVVACEKKLRLRPFGRFYQINHQRILNALETQRGKDLFIKKKDRFDHTRQFYLKKA